MAFIDGADYTITTKVVAGIPCTIYGFDELLGTAVEEYDLVIALHGRTRNQWQMRLYANYILKKHYETELSNKRGLLVVAIDHRNHGARTVDAQRNRGWEEGNIWHAEDMLSMIYGGYQDVRLLVRCLPFFLFRENRACTLTNAICTGFSMGGHVTYTAVAHDPLIAAGVVICGCPDYRALMVKRCEEVGKKYDKWHGITSGVVTLARELKPTVEALSEKDLLIMKGDRDTIVPFSVGEEFVGQLPGNRVQVSGFNVGHEFAEEMMIEGADWINNWREEHLEDATIPKPHY